MTLTIALRRHTCEEHAKSPVSVPLTATIALIYTVAARVATVCLGTLVQGFWEPCPKGSGKAPLIGN